VLERVVDWTVLAGQRRTWVTFNWHDRIRPNPPGYGSNPTRPTTN